MRRATLFAVFLPFLAPAAAEDSTPSFLSWYDGWGIHTVWGIGKVQGSYAGAFVTCGGERIPVSPIYDTHQPSAKPRDDQSADFARHANRQLLKQLRAAKVSCTF